MEGDNHNSEAPFNMAIATLKRLDLILIQIRQMHSQYPQDSIIKQKAHIDLVKQFYLNATPLFDPAEDDKNADEKKGLKTMKELGKEILSFTTIKKAFIRNRNQKVHEIYSHKKEIRLNEILEELQSKLKRFFMPGKKFREGLM